MDSNDTFTIILRDIVLAVGTFTIAAFILVVVVFTIGLWADSHRKPRPYRHPHYTELTRCRDSARWTDAEVYAHDVRLVACLQNRRRFR